MTEKEVKNLKNLDCIRHALESIGYIYNELEGLCAVFSDDGDYSMVYNDISIQQNSGVLIMGDKNISLSYPLEKISILAIYPDSIILGVGGVKVNISKTISLNEED